MKTAARDQLHASIGEAIRARRQSSGMTAERLATAMSGSLGTVTKGSLLKLEEGMTAPLWMLVAAAEAFDCTLDDLVEVQVP
jgi:transcriptional regulator with XRE-family HTH domain